VGGAREESVAAGSGVGVWLRMRVGVRCCWIGLGGRTRTNGLIRIDRIFCRVHLRGGSLLFTHCENPRSKCG
jgi:hypothetical protein